MRKWREMKVTNNMNIRNIKLHSYLIALYFLLAPMEDVLSGSAGSLARYLAIIIVAVGLIEKNWKIPILISKTNVCVMILMLVSVLSVIWSIDRATTISHWRTYLLLPAIYLFIGTMDFDEKEYRLIVYAAIIGGFIAGLYMLFSGNIMASGRMRLTEGNDPNNFSALMFLPATLAWGQIQTEQKKLRILHMFFFAFCVFNMLLTGSRGGIIGLLIMLLFYFITSRMYKNISIMFGVIILGFILWRFVIPLLPSEMIIRMFNLRNYSYQLTGSGRTEIWQTFIQNVMPRMGLFGLGAGCASVSLVSFFGSARGVHNTYLNMIGEFGILGIPAFLFMIGFALRESLKEKYYLGASMLLGMCTIIFFLDSYPKKFFWNVLILITIHAISYRRNTIEN